MPTDPIELVGDAHAQIAESPTWSAAEQALYWMDVKAPALYRFDPVSGMNREWKLPDEIGCFALYANEAAALVALRCGLFRLELGSGALTRLTEPPFDPAIYRFNEGGCDPRGRFWLGVMYEPKDAKGTPVPSPLLRYTQAEGLVPQADAAATPNGLAWSPDGRTMYFAHTKQHAIFRFDFDLETGRIANQRLFATVPENVGVPDGAAMDEEGCYWSAIHGGSRLIRFTPDGAVDREVKLPVSLPTMPAFGGPDMDVLYFTSASAGLGLLHKATEPHAGGLFRFRPGVRGVPRSGFSG